MIRTTKKQPTKKKKTNHILNTLIAIVVIIVIALINKICSSEQGNYGESVAIAIPYHNTTDLYLFPAMSEESPAFILQNTTYQIFRNGDFLGEWPANRLDPLNLTLFDNLSNQNKTITFMPYDEIEFLITAEHEDPNFYVKPYHDGFMVHDVPLTYYVPRMEVIDTSTVKFHVDDEETFEKLSDINWTISMKSNDFYKLEIDLQGHDFPYDYFCCNYDKNDVDILTGLYHSKDFFRDPLCSSLQPFSLSRKDRYFEMHIESSDDFQNTTIQCHFTDETYFINEDGKIHVSIFDENEIDIGLPNIGFNITAIQI